MDLRNYIHLLLLCTIFFKVSFFERCNALLDFAVSLMMCISNNTGLSPNFNCCGRYHTTYHSVKSLAKVLARQFFIPSDAVFSNTMFLHRSPCNRHPSSTDGVASILLGDEQDEVLRYWMKLICLYERHVRVWGSWINTPLSLKFGTIRNEMPASRKCLFVAVKR